MHLGKTWLIKGYLHGQYKLKLVQNAKAFWLLKKKGGPPRWLMGKESACPCRNPWRLGFDLWVRRILGGGNDNKLQYSWLENSMDRGAWWATVHRIAKSRTWLRDWACKHNRGKVQEKGLLETEEGKSKRDLKWFNQNTVILNSDLNWLFPEWSSLMELTRLHNE